TPDGAREPRLAERGAVLVDQRQVVAVAQRETLEGAAPERELGLGLRLLRRLARRRTDAADEHGARPRRAHLDLDRGGTERLRGGGGRRAAARTLPDAVEPDVLPRRVLAEDERRALAALAVARAQTQLDRRLERLAGREAGRERARRLLELEREAARRRARPVEAPVAVRLVQPAAERRGVDAVDVERREQPQQTSRGGLRAHDIEQALFRELCAREDPAQVDDARARRRRGDEWVGVGEDPHHALA